MNGTTIRHLEFDRDEIIVSPSSGESVANRFETPAILENALLFKEIGFYNTAGSLLEHCIKLFEKERTIDNTNLTKAFVALAEIKMAHEKYDEAENWLIRCLKRSLIYKVEGQRPEIEILLKLGAVYASIGAPHEISEILSIINSIAPPDPDFDPAAERAWLSNASFLDIMPFAMIEENDGNNDGNDDGDYQGDRPHSNAYSKADDVPGNAPESNIECNTPGNGKDTIRKAKCEEKECERPDINFNIRLRLKNLRAHSRMLKGNYVGASWLVKNALYELSMRNEQDPVLKADLLKTQAEVQKIFGDYESALKAAVEAANILTRRYGPGHPETAVVHKEISEIQYRMKNYQDALESEMKYLSVMVKRNSR